MSMSVMRKLGCILAGVLFALGWFIFIDGAVLASEDPTENTLKWYYYIPGILGSIALLMINAAPLQGSENDVFDDDEGTVPYPTKLRFWFFLSFTIAFCTVASGIWIFVAEYSHSWIGIAILLQPILILSSTVLLLLIRMAGLSLGFQVV